MSWSDNVARSRPPSLNGDMGAWSTNTRSIGRRHGAMTARRVCPHWNIIDIDDIYSGSAQGERYFTMHVLLGDVIVVQPNAYAQAAFQVA